ncbi:MAG: hypothetical protein Q9179_004700 [Wetmoreana sp. 5 TL-2023]
MRKLTENSTKDAAAVKVLMMIALVYLPMTVVSDTKENTSKIRGCQSSSTPLFDTEDESPEEIKEMSYL